MKKKNIKYIVLFVLAICLIIALVIWRCCPPMPDASATTTNTTTEITVDTNPESSGTVPGSEPGGTEDGTEPSDQVTEPSGEVTEPSEPSGDGTEPTTHPSEPVNPSDPTEPSEPVTDPTDPVAPTDPTEPAPTEPDPTEPTEPDPTQPTEPPHSHDFSSVVTAPTCTEKGYTTYTCKTCGYSYKGSETAAKGHSYNGEITIEATCTENGVKTYTCFCGDSYVEFISETGHNYVCKSFKKATCTTDGVETYVCSNCNASYTKTTLKTGHSYGDWVIVKEPTETAEGKQERTCKNCGDTQSETLPMVKGLATPADEYEAAVVQAIFKYINQFRVEEGKSELVFLPGMSQVAQYRSRQLVSNFAHDAHDIREAHAYYEYGKYVDMSKYGYESYYSSSTGEAIGYTSSTGTYTIDELGYHIATQYRESPGHWSYLGSDEYTYCGIGTTWGEYHCIMVGTVNYG